MGFLDLFKTKAERAADERALARREQRELDKATEAVSQQAVSLQQKLQPVFCPTFSVHP